MKLLKRHEEDLADQMARGRIKAQEKSVKAEASRESMARKEAKQAAKSAAKQAKKDQRHGQKAEIKSYRDAHPMERQMNQAAMLHMWPRAECGMTPFGPVKGGSAELWNADAHKSWTASRVAGNTVGVASLGMIPTFSGRKSRGAAAINVTFGNGTAQSFAVKPQDLAAANRYVTAFNALSRQLEGE
ncbi:hypothetical protein [Streptomyces sp. NPDC057301]|uniref:hypothetical protein n=1 Tax=Streptomyces sp. NPDC057301 TaxID=3346093 RepID=UPI00363A0657